MLMKTATTLYQKTRIRLTGCGVTPRQTHRSRGERGAVQYQPQVRRGARKRVAGSAAIVGVAILALAALPASADPPAPPPTPTASADINPGPATLTPFTGDTAIEDRLDAAGHVVIRASGCMST